MRDPTDAADTQVLVREGETLKLRARKLRIEILAGPNAGQTAEVFGPEVRIGSGSGNQLVLLDPTVSRHHVTLRVEPRAIRVSDAGSSNGTSLDGVRILEAYARDGSTLSVGRSSLRLGLTDEYVDVPLSTRESFGRLLGKSPAMRQVFTLLERIAAAADPVLIEGETGTGKELAAEAIHEEGPRSAGPFVVFDCSAVSANLIESELFGHVKGAFTGAVADRKGALEAADGGTLFLDEIGELPPELQPKLLRALEKFEVRRVGSNDPRRVDVRIVVATNRNLQEEVSRGRFREDLYYRLAVLLVRLPPLRERTEDIPVLAQHFAVQLAGEAPPSLPLAKLQAQAWPGNVRELRNAVARAVSLGHVGGRGAPRPSVAVDLSVPLMEARDRLAAAFEEAYLRQALLAAGGNATKAAALAGVNRKFVQRAMRRYALR